MSWNPNRPLVATVSTLTAAGLLTAVLFGDRAPQGFDWSNLQLQTYYPADSVEGGAILDYTAPDDTSGHDRLHVLAECASASEITFHEAGYGESWTVRQKGVCKNGVVELGEVAMVSSLAEDTLAEVK